MGSIVYMTLCLLGCFILGSSSTPVEGLPAKGEMPLPVKSEAVKENKIPADANGLPAKGEMPLPVKSEAAKENKIPADAGVANSSQVVPRSSCRSGAYYFRRNCYEYFPSAVPWYDAEYQCQKLKDGSHLASFSSLNEEKLVSAYIRSLISTNSVWIGLNAVQDSGKLIWEWSDESQYSSGSPLWDNRSPSIFPSPLQCVLLNNILNPSNSLRWLQTSCENRYSYVCKYKA